MKQSPNSSTSAVSLVVRTGEDNLKKLLKRLKFSETQIEAAYQTGKIHDETLNRLTEGDKTLLGLRLRDREKELFKKEEIVKSQQSENERLKAELALTRKMLEEKNATNKELLQRQDLKDKAERDRQQKEKSDFEKKMLEQNEQTMAKMVEKLTDQ